MVFRGMEMIVKQRLASPWLIGLCIVALLVLFLKIEPVRANANHAAATGQSCATCHYTGSTPSAGNLTGIGQNFVRCGYILNCSVAPAPPPQVAQPQQPNFQGNTGANTQFQLGNIWIVQLNNGRGESADLIWTRRGSSNVFDVMWHLNGSRFTDVLNYEGYRNGQISFYSPALKSRFIGSPTRDGNYIVNGTTSDAATDRWSATIFGN
jgi:hypothetical protein